MTKLFRTLGISFIIILSTGIQSCIDKEYDFDNLNKNVEVKVPPIPLGSLDTIFVNFLPSIPPEIILGAKVTLSDTVRGLFDENTISTFFYEGSDDVVISSKIDVMVMPQTSGLRLDVILNIIDRDKKRNEFVKIPIQTLTFGKNQDFSIRIKSEYMKYMKNARDLHFIFAFSVSAINFNRTDYIFIRRFLLSTGGIQFEL